MSRDVTDQRANANGDLGAFDKSSTDYLTGMSRTLADVPGGPQALIAASQLVTQHRDNMVTDDASRGIRNSQEALESSIAGANNDLSAMARQGNIGSPEYYQRMNERNVSYEALQSNPLFGYSPAKVLDEIKKQDVQLHGGCDSW